MGCTFSGPCYLSVPVQTKTLTTAPLRCARNLVGLKLAEQLTNKPTDIPRPPNMLPYMLHARCGVFSHVIYVRTYVPWFA